ncbi:kinesin family protein-like protein [Phyllosticta paracitricarpa]|uniref:Kinesin-like protein n=1 Tax=Phyllosticta paracitricarpa TaxID=2016321 RepID=A0ABR1NA56_9PEZI
MYPLLQLRSRRLRKHCCDLLEVTMDPRAYRGLASSTASSPSLRANTPHQTTTTTTNMSDSGNVKVVVRVRGFVKRELERGAECLVRMDPQTQETILLPPGDNDAANSRTSTRKITEEKKFIFDKSFWSHDNVDPHFAKQEDVYNSFGGEFLNHNFEGYHTCIFAYGQTGSGKSYTMMGTPEQPGLIPRTCHELFDRIQNDPTPNTTYSVHVSYFEVYNEHVRDLLAQRTNPAVYLKIRESQTDGVYVQGLSEAPVKSYVDVARLMRTGDLNRTTASTKMNDTSSRSHAVFTIHLKQMQHSLLTDETIERSARMRLVDLAGSERVKTTEATGQRLVEGGKINKSLTTLGRVIAALAHNGSTGPTSDTRRRSSAGKKKELVPYRDSVLTWILKDSLGGNSKTAMVACIAPADYDETLSTLRYADQAKRIRTRATINQDSLSSAQRDAQIAAMAEQIRQLQVSVNASALRRQQAEAAELEDYQRRVEVMQRLMEETRQVSEAKIKALTAEVEELRPVNEALRAESEALRRHLTLALGELKNPIVLPVHMENNHNNSTSGGDADDEYENDSGVEADFYAASEEGANEYYEYADVDGAHEALAAELQAKAEVFLKDIGVFRRKVQDDNDRFSTAWDSRSASPSRGRERDV